MRLAFLVVTILIVYGSLFPFTIDLSSYRAQSLESLFYFGLSEVSRGDLIANIVLFIPFGFLGMQLLPIRSTPLRVGVVSLTSFVLAFAIQAAQLFVPGRDPVGSDTTLNVVGCVIGSMLALTQFNRLISPLAGHKRRPDMPMILAITWLLYELAPFVPSIDLQLLKDHIKALVGGVPNGMLIIQNTVMWLVVFHFLRRSNSRILSEKTYPVIVALTLTASLFVVGGAVSSEKFLGGLVALPTWWLIRHYYDPSWLVICLTTAIIGISFMPFELHHSGIDFAWVPFTGALSGDLAVNVAATLKKIAMYGSLIWLLIEIRWPLRTATGATAIFLFLNEYLQTFFTNTSPEITDPLLALALGIGFHRYQRTASENIADGADQFTAREDDHASRSTRSNRQSPEMQRANSVHYLPGMDGLRAIAAIAVFFVHFNQKVGLSGAYGPFDLERLLANGNTGVALFFILSGLLLSLPFWQAKLGQAPPPAIPAYAWRRIGRIVPAYYLCLFIILFAKSIGGAGPSWNNILSHLLFVHNLSDWNILSLNEPFWTLAVEAQFYVILPLLFLALRKTTPVSAVVVISLLVPLLYFLNHGIVGSIVANAAFPVHQTLLWPFALYLSGPESFVLTYSTLGHLPHFLLGVLAARLYLHLLTSGAAARRNQALFDGIVLSLALGTLLILATPIDDVLQTPHGRYNFPYIPLMLAGLVVAVPFTRVTRGFLTSRVIAWLGAISYGIYIFHQPVQKVINRGMGWLDFPAQEHGLIFLAITLAGTLVCSQISYTLLEVPAMRWIRRRFGRGNSDSVDRHVADRGLMPQAEGFRPDPITRPEAPETSVIRVGDRRLPPVAANRSQHETLPDFRPSHISSPSSHTAAEGLSPAGYFAAQTLLVTILYFAATSDIAPYNVKELLGPVPLFSIAVLALAATLYFLPLTVWGRRLAAVPSRVFSTGLWLVGHGLLSYLLLRSLVPLESLHDILGYPVTTLPHELERLGRFLALELPVAVIFMGGPVAWQAVRTSRPQGYLYWVALLLPAVAIGHWITVTEAATVNLTELMRDGGTVFTTYFLVLWGWLLAVTAYLLTVTVARQLHPGIALLGAAVAVPLGYLLLYMALEPSVYKYGQYFSALQFLLSPSRVSYVRPELVPLLYAAVHIGATIAIALAQYPYWLVQSARFREKFAKAGVRAFFQPTS